MNGIYIVGNARSGTTMMGRILNNHSLIHTFTEIHFFEQLWSGKESSKILSSYDGMQLCALLLNIAREGYFSKRHVGDFISDAEKIIYNEQLTSLEIYRRVLQSETLADGKSIFCKQTPQNVFYIREIKEALPGSKFIFMVRDPRSVLLSQKNKWRRRFLGGSHVNRYEMVRSWFNYHPITISQLWNSSFNSGMKFVKDENLLQVRFEDLLSEPEKTIRIICGFLNISFETKMLQIPKVGSSIGEDNPNETGIRTDRKETWKQGGLTAVEIYLCEKICRDGMKTMNYPVSSSGASLPAAFVSYLTYPVKLGGAFLLNLHRMKNIRETIKKRLGR